MEEKKSYRDQVRMYALDPLVVEGLAESKAKNFRKAFELYEQGMRNGNFQAQILLAGLYLTGEGAPYNKKKYFSLIKDVGDRDYGPAFFSLSDAYIRGCGVKKNKKLGLYYLRKLQDIEPPPDRIEQLWNFMEKYHPGFYNKILKKEGR